MPTSFQPIINDKSKILILGTLPGTKSLECEQYYGESRNHFWRILYSVFDETLNENYDERKAFITNHHLSLWDVLHSAERKGALDSAIKQPIPNDFTKFFKQYPHIKFVLFNGTKAESLFMKYYHTPTLEIEFFRLPSTSAVPGRNVLSFEQKCEVWKSAIQSCL